MFRVLIELFNNEDGTIAIEYAPDCSFNFDCRSRHYVVTSAQTLSSLLLLAIDKFLSKAVGLGISLWWTGTPCPHVSGSRRLSNVARLVRHPDPVSWPARLWCRR
jgi:hypothetical protein